MQSAEFESQYQRTDWLYTTPISDIFNGDNSAVLVGDGVGVLIPSSTREGSFSPAHANKVVSYGLGKRDAIVLMTDATHSGFLVSQIGLGKGVAEKTVRIIAQMDTPQIVVLTHTEHQLRESPLLPLQKQLYPFGCLPLISEKKIFTGISADIAIMHWKGKLIANIRATEQIAP